MWTQNELAAALNGHPIIGWGEPPPPLERIVTPEQLTQGYLERVGGIVYHRSYKVLRHLSDGNIVVSDPESQCTRPKP